MAKINGQILQLKNLIKPGRIYRPKDFTGKFKRIDVLLNLLVKEGYLAKSGRGKYYHAAKTVFGTVAPDIQLFIAKTLGTSKYLIITTGDYNSLGLGLTQLSNALYVYNYKRHETIEKFGVTINFKRPGKGFPPTANKEYLVIDILNNIRRTGESEEMIINKLPGVVKALKPKELYFCSNKYGKIKTQKIIKGILNGKVIPA